jgi:eukaryotic-like serine/threonine-protein kinase
MPRTHRPSAAQPRRIERRFALGLAVLLCLGAAVPALAQCPDGTPPPCAGAIRAAPNSLAVLPFESLSRDSGDVILAEGFTEELNSRLGRLTSLEVMSRGVVKRYRGQEQDPIAVGRALHVAYVVSGSLRRSGDRVRVTAELARSRDGTQAWADLFDRASADLMTIEADLAQAVAVAIAGRLLPHEQAALASRPTRDPAAWDAFLRGNALIARRMTGGLPGAVEAYEEAVRLDPSFAAAWGRLAEARSLGSAYGYLGPGRDTQRLRQQAHDAAARAWALDSTSAEAWIARGFVLGDSGRWSDAITALGHAVALDSTLAEAHYHLGTSLEAYSDDGASAERHLRTAHTLDPSLANAVEWYVVLLWKEGRPFEALEWLDTLGAMAPALSRASRIADLRAMDFTLDLLLRTGDTARVRAGLTAFLAASRGTDSTGAQALAARVRAGLGDTAEARAALSRAEAPSGAAMSLQVASLLAAAQVALGERARALACLEGRRGDGPDLWDAMHRPYFEPLRREPRFARLMQEVRPR